MNLPMSKKFHKKRQARKIVFSALYASLVTGGLIDLAAMEKQVTQDAESDFDYAKELFQAYQENHVIIDEAINACSTHKKRSGNTDVELAILKMAAAELISAKAPTRVVINEAIELTKEYGAEDGYKYINAVLDGIVKRWS